MPSEDYGAVGLEDIIGQLRAMVGDDDDDDYGDDDEDEDMDDMLAEIISGADDDDDDDDEVDIGRRRRPGGPRRPRTFGRRVRMNKQLRALLRARIADPKAVSVRTRKQSRRRRWLIPIPTTTLAASASAEVTIQPQRLVKPKRIIIPSSIADDFDFTDIKVGQQSQFVAGGEVPAACLVETSVDAYVDFDTANIGNLISLEVTNTDAGAPHDFKGCILGTAVY